MWSAVDSYFEAGGQAAARYVSQLRQAAIEAGHGRWLFEVAAGTYIKTALPPMISVIRGQAEPAQLRDGVRLGSHDRDMAPGAEIAAWSSFSAGPLRRLSSDLLVLIADNEAKLRAATGFERHLAVQVRALTGYDPSGTAIPDLPPEIDFLWVVRNVISGPVLWLTNGVEPWRVTGDLYFNTDGPPIEPRSATSR